MSAGHRVSHCKSRPCFKCWQKHHKSTCESTGSSIDQLSTANEGSQDTTEQDTGAREQPAEKGMSGMTESSSTIHPTLLAIISGATRIMVNTGATSSYVCTDLITKLGIKPVRREQCCVGGMYGTMKKMVEVYNIAIKSSVIEGFQLNVDCINAEKDILTHVQNPKITKIKNQNPRITRICIMLRVANYQRI